MSDSPLSTSEQCLLNKGLSYVPIPKLDPFKLKVEMFKFYRSIKLKYFYRKDNVQVYSPSNAPPLRVKSKFCPPVNNSTIDTFIKLVDKDIDNLTKTKNLRDMGRPERDMLKTLSKNHNVIYRPADKGGGLCVLNRTDYVNEAMSQLSNTSCYVKLDKDPTVTYKKEIDSFLQDSMLEGCITPTECKFLTKEHPSVPLFYCVPKIHKSLSHPPGRPIVASNDSLTEPLSQFVDRHMRPIVTKLPSYLRDTGDFIHQLSEVIIPNSTDDIFLVTLDVVSLYTNIPHTLGMEALRHFLDLRDELIPPSNFLVEMTSMILYKNYFLFENDYYLQLQGAPMGSVFSPDYAGIALGYLEHNSIWHNNPFIHNMLLFKRYIDDIFLVWQGSEEELHNFVTYLNNLTPTIKFNMECSRSEIPFLDTRVLLQKGKLSTTLYTKPTDKNSLLHATSAHPPALKKGLPYSQFLRLKRICSSQSDYEKEKDNMYKNFIERGYPRKWLDSALTKLENENQVPKIKKKHSCACITTYNPQSNDLRSIIEKHWHVLSADPECAKLFTEPPLFSHYRSQSIRDYMVKADCYTPPQQHSGRLDGVTGFYPCLHCVACKSSKKMNTFKSAVTNKEYTIRQFVNCSSSNVVYMIFCKCNLQYVGKTSRPVRTRIIEHMSAIRRKDIKSPVARHFMEAGHSTADLSFTVIEQVKKSRRGGDLDTKLLQTESRWIYYMQSVNPGGMNEDLSLQCYL